jgi:tetratricopeptide (TPR) repeat protein
MIVVGELTPVASLSAAFLAPPSMERLQFAYFESSLFVDFLIQRYGLEPLKAILRDLGDGVEINRAIAAHTGPLPELERAFAAFARAKADQLAPRLDWARPPADLLEPGAETALADWARAQPDNYWALRMEARELVDGKQWARAEAVLTHFIDLDPAQIGADSAYAQLATVAHARGEAATERSALARLAAIDDNATDAYLRLMDIAQAARDWPAVERYAGKFLAVNPLVAPPYAYLARAAQEQGDTPGAIAANRALLQLAPPNPAEVHFQLARLLHQQNDPEARRQVLEALEDAPRYREALALLLEIDPAGPPADPASP